jgi:hypothetical protein
MAQLKINHHSYLTEDIDRAVMVAQAERRRDRDGEVTLLHNHPYESPTVTYQCNEKCMVFRPGYETYSINEHPVLKKEDT